MSLASSIGRRRGLSSGVPYDSRPNPRHGYGLLQGGEAVSSCNAGRVACIFKRGVRMSTAEKIRSNAEVHGVAWAAKWAARNGINISTVRRALFGRY